MLYKFVILEMGGSLDIRRPSVNLKGVCATRGLPTSGTGKVLLDRIRQDVSFALELLSASAEGSIDGYRSIGADDGGIILSNFYYLLAYAHH